MFCTKPVLMNRIMHAIRIYVDSMLLCAIHPTPAVERSQAIIQEGKPDEVEKKLAAEYQNFETFNSRLW